MITLFIENIMSFFTKQWGVIASVGFGLLVLVRGVRYIEESALNKERVRNMRDSVNRIIENKEKIDGYVKNVGDLDRDSLLSVMREYGELRDVKSE